MTSHRHPPDHRGRAIPDGSWPDGREAPDGLEFVRRFLNTTNLESGADRLETPALLDRWLRAEGRPAQDLSTAELSQLVAIREQLRDHLAARSVDPGGRKASAPTDLLPSLNVCLEDDGRGWFAFSAAGPHGLETLLVELATALVVASGTGTLARLKTCTNPHCRWAFYDWSRNSGGRWCSMQACGGRHKARTYRRRRSSRGDTSG